MLRPAFLVLLVLLSFLSPGQNILTLEQCIAYGLENNLQIRQYALQINQKKNELRQKNFSLAPSLSGSAQQGYSFGNSLDYTTYEYHREQINSSYFALNSNLVLFSGLSQLNNIKASRYGYLSSQEAWEDLKDQMSLNIASIYLEILMNAEQIRFADTQLVLSRKLLERAKLLVEVGDENKVKELQLRAQVANDEVTKIDAENQMELSYIKLKQYLNWDMTKPIYIVTTGINMVQPPDYLNLPIDTFIERSVLRLPRVKKASYDFQSAKYSYLSSFGQITPTLALQSGIYTRYSSTNVSLPNLEKIPFHKQVNDNLSESFSFGLNVPIFNNLQGSFAVKSAKINMKNSELTLEITKNTARSDIYQAYQLVMSSNKKYIASSNNQLAQKLLFDQNNLMYEQGLISFYDWQSAKNSLLQAETTFFSAKYDYIYKLKVLEYYIGLPIKL